jgi:glycosyltransferase involved in cell wall biosynthesis
MNNPLEKLPKIALSLCMIVKNERENLPRCLDSVKSYVNEMIIVDTGSEDGTPELAANYGATVRYFEWCDDFAAARNYAISQASGHWVLMLDADEELMIESEDFFKEVAFPSEILAYNITYTEVNDFPTRTPTYRPSLFRNIPELRYVSRLHEYLTYKNQYIRPEELGDAPSIKIVHYGHFKEKVKQKTINRNLPILERIRQKEELSIYLLHCLARMYTETKQIDKAQECYDEAFERLFPNLLSGTLPEDFSFVPILYDLGMQFFEKTDYETARLLCQGGLEWCPDFPPINYLTGVLLNALGFPLGATAYFKKCIKLGQDGTYYKWCPFDLIFITTYPAYNLGLMYLQVGQPQEALAAFELALCFDADFTAAREKADIIRQYLATQA